MHIKNQNTFSILPARIIFLNNKIETTKAAANTPAKIEPDPLGVAERGIKTDEIRAAKRLEDANKALEKAVATAKAKKPGKKEPAPKISEPYEPTEKDKVEAAIAKASTNFNNPTDLEIALDGDGVRISEDKTVVRGPIGSYIVRVEGEPDRYIFAND